MNVPVLLLDVAWRIDRVIRSDRAVELLTLGRVVAASEEIAAIYHSPSTTIEVPSVVARTGGAVGPLRLAACSHRKVRLRDAHRCQFVHDGVACTRRGDSVDHLVPRSHGGPSTWTNLVAACRACNGRKRDIDFDEMCHRYGWALVRQPFAPTREALILAAVGDPRPGWERFLPESTRCA